jgi:TPR repeat protein
VQGHLSCELPHSSRDFATRPPEITAALAAAFDGYRNRYSDNILSALDKIEQQDPLVELFRGIARIAKSSHSDRAQNEAQAERHLRAAMNAGEPKAAAILSVLLASKLHGIAEDIPQARELGESTPHSNDPFTIRQLAIQLLSENLGPENPERAADLMWTAAELGDAVANAMLGASFSAGTGWRRTRPRPNNICAAPPISA